MSNIKNSQTQRIKSSRWILNFGSLSKSHYPFLFRSYASQGIFESSTEKKKKTSNPLEPRFTRVRTRFILEYHSVRAWMLQGKEVRATRRSVSGGRKIDIATRTLGYSVNDDKRLPRTITADNGKNHCWKRGGWNTSPGWRSQE